MTLTRKPAELVREAENSGRPGLLGKHPTWVRLGLDDVATVINGCAFSSTFFNRQGEGLPLIRIRDVGADSPSTFYSGPFEDRYLVHSGDLLIGMDGDFRVSEWRGTVGLLNQRVCRLEVRNLRHYDKRFLALVLQGYLDAIWSATSSITVKHLSSRSVQEIPLPLPPIAEQYRIVESLEFYLSCVADGHRYIAQARRRLRHFELILLSSAVERHYAHWNEIAIGELACVTSGATPSRGRSEYYDGGSIPWVTSSQLNHPFVRNATQFITQRALKETSVKLLEPGTLLLAMYGEGKTRGKCSELTFSATTNQACAAIALNSDVIDLRAWIKTVLEARYETNRRLSAGGVQPNLNLSLIKQMTIPIPPEEERNELLAQLDTSKRAHIRLESELVKLRNRTDTLRRTLLTDAFSGGLVAQDSNDEPAWTLLERIKEKGRGKPPDPGRAPRTAKNADPERKSVQ